MVNLQTNSDKKVSRPASCNLQSSITGLCYTLDEMENTFNKVAFDWYSSDMSDITEERKKVGKCMVQMSKIVAAFKKDEMPERFVVSTEVMEETFINLILDWYSANLSEDLEERSRVSECMSQFKKLLKICQLI